MLLLAAGGRTVEALNVFDRVRRELASELGLDPSQELRRAHEHVLRLTVPNDATAGDAPRQLPADLATFSGRADELAWALSMAEPRGTVVVSAIGGMAGIGKSTFAVHWGHKVAARFPDGQLYANLRGFDETERAVDPSDALRGFLAALGVEHTAIPAALDQQAALFRSRSAGRRMLVVLDNVRDEAQARPLLPGSAGCLVIVTSRHQLSGLVAVDGAYPLRLDLLREQEAYALLAMRIGADRLAAEPEATGEIIAFCGGLPLALAIVAARAVTGTACPLAGVAADLRLDTLSGSDPASSVRAVFSWSYRILTPPAARLFRLLSLCPANGVTPATLASLTDAQPLNELLRAELAVEVAPGRYGQHDLLRAYAGDLCSAEEREHGLRRLYDHYLSTLDNAERVISPSLQIVPLPEQVEGVNPEQFATQAQAVAWLRAEETALITLIERADQSSLDRHLMLLAIRMRAHLDRSMPPATVITALRNGRAAAVRLGDNYLHVRLNLALATAHAKIAQFDEAIAELVEGRDLAARAGDESGHASTMVITAQVLYRQGNTEDALTLVYDALPIYERLGERRSLARSLSAAGWLHTERGEYDKALAVCEQALAFYRELTEISGEAATWDSIGHARLRLGHHQQAIQAYAQSIDMSRQISDRDMEATALDGLGDAYTATGDHSAARQAWERSLQIFDALGHPAAGKVRAKLARD